MKIFLSWSGKLSKKTAEALKTWLKNDIFSSETLDVFFSADDIAGGVDWYGQVRAQLKLADMAIICITRENMSRPWLTFEAGAILGSKEDKRAVPLVIDDGPASVTGPLNKSQAIGLNNEDFVKLVQGIIEVGELKSITPQHVQTVVNAKFPKFHEEVLQFRAQIESDYRASVIEVYPAEVIRTKIGRTFLGSPMASTKSEDEYKHVREMMLELRKALLKHSGTREVYYPAEAKENKTAFDGKKSALKNDFKILKECENFVFYYPTAVPSSVLLEIGYAIALSRKIVIFTTSRENLPFMLQEADKAVPNLDIYECRDIDEVIRVVAGNGNDFLN
ncbi:MAG TPA: toll/interleukin-1 receptor domain-containing protein [Candidatus Saccharimonadia bacterium]|nr:toll/interleukin-1 receptor domain-containing protein [Candidatus Saccharimonadia bacterium]